MPYAATARAVVLVLLAGIDAAASRKTLPKVTAKGMMRWKKWWWNDQSGLRQCDDPYGCNDLDEAADKVSGIKARWLVDSDAELLAYMRRVRAHASTHQWSEGGRVYSFCRFYQADLQDVLDYLELKVAKEARRAASQEKRERKRAHDGAAVPPTSPFQQAAATEEAPQASEAKGDGEHVRFEEARDRLEYVEVGQQASEMASGASSWFVLVLGSLWSYVAGFVGFADKKEKEL